MARRSDHTRDELRRMALDAARAIVEEDGLRGLSTRRLAKAIGYTPERSTNSSRISTS